MKTKANNFTYKSIQNIFCRILLSTSLQIHEIFSSAQGTAIVANFKRRFYYFQNPKLLYFKRRWSLGECNRCKSENVVWCLKKLFMQTLPKVLLFFCLMISFDLQLQKISFLQSTTLLYLIVNFSLIYMRYICVSD